MAKFKLYDYVEIIATGRTGTITDIEGRKYEVESYLPDGFDVDYNMFTARELRPAEKIRPDATQIKALVRGELSRSELTDGNFYLGALAEENDYRLCLEDLYAGFMTFMDAGFCSGDTITDFEIWCDTIVDYKEDICPEGRREIITDLVTVQDFLDEAVAELCELNELIWGECTDDEIMEAAGAFRSFLEDGLQHKNGWGPEDGIPEKIAVRIAEQFDDDSIDSQSEATQKMFRKSLDMLCDRKIPWAIRKRGYCYYCGTKIYPNDWAKARDAFLEYYEMTGDASAANTLGYIFYYGRCTDGVPEYDRAFRYFSIGHAFGYFESTYKLADMFAHGYGVRKSGITARRLYENVYNENRERFIRGDMTCKFADAALRMGNCARDGIGMAAEPSAAYTYYLEADLAIRERIKAADHYGDNVVYAGVQKALAAARKEYKDSGIYYMDKYPGWAEVVLIDHRRCRCSFRELKNNSYTLTFEPLPYPGEEKAPKILFSDVRAGYCSLSSKLKVKAAAGSGIEVKTDADSFVFNCYEYDWESDTVSLYMDETEVARITASKYGFIHPKKKKEAHSGEKHHFVSIVFGAEGRTYDYLCEDASVKSGDRVIVNGYNGETEVEVVDVFDQYESELGLPLERYRKIVRKV